MIVGTWCFFLSFLSGVTVTREYLFTRYSARAILNSRFIITMVPGLSRERQELSLRFAISPVLCKYMQIGRDYSPTKFQTYETHSIRIEKKGGKTKRKKKDGQKQKMSARKQKKLNKKKKRKNGKRPLSILFNVLNKKRR